MARLNGFDKHFKPGPPTKCWHWPGPLNVGGYGVAHVKGERIVAHRVAYERFVGPIPDGLQLDHLCRSRDCVNPSHLEPVTGKENVLRGIGQSAINARKTHCFRGHPLGGANLLLSKAGARVCKECSRQKVRAWRKLKGVNGWGQPNKEKRRALPSAKTAQTEQQKG